MKIFRARDCILKRNISNKIYTYLAQMFSSEFCELFKNAFYRTPLGEWLWRSSWCPYDFRKSYTKILFKACVRYFLWSFYFSPNDSPLKTTKNGAHFQHDFSIKMFLTEYSINGQSSNVTPYFSLKISNKMCYHVFI